MAKTEWITDSRWKAVVNGLKRTVAGFEIHVHSPSVGTWNVQIRRERYLFTACGFKSPERAKTFAYDTAKTLGKLPRSPK